MKKPILIASLITAFALPAFAQIPPVTPSKDASQIRDDNHDIRPDRVDQRSDDKNLNSSEAKELRHKKMKRARQVEKEQREGVPQPAIDEPPTTK